MLSLVVPKVLCVRRADTAKITCIPTWKVVSMDISRRKEKAKGRQASVEHESESPVVHHRQWKSTVLAISKYAAFMRLVSSPLTKPSCPRVTRFAEPHFEP